MKLLFDEIRRGNASTGDIEAMLREQREANPGYYRLIEALMGDWFVSR